MALQDTPTDAPSFTDPKTGQPYPYGSPEYQAAIIPFLQNALMKQAEQSSNARGMFFSGPAMADEQQAAEQLTNQMAQAGAAQSEQEQITKEQQAFAQQQQLEQEQAAAAQQKSANAAGMKGAAIGGGSQALGMMTALKMFGPKTPGAPGAVGPSEFPAATEWDASSLPEQDFTSTEGLGGLPAGGGVTVPTSDLSAEVSSGVGGGGGGGFGSLVPSFNAGSLAAGAAGAYGASTLMDKIPGMNNTAAHVGSGVGGAAGEYFGGPIGATAGSAMGAAVGNQLNKPVQGALADLLLGPLGPVATSIPGFSEDMGEAGRWIGNRLGI